MQKLRNMDGTGSVTIPKDDLDRDGLVDDDGELPDDQHVVVDRLDEGCYAIRFVDSGDVPELAECEAIERIAAQRMLQQDALGSVRAD